LLYVLEINIEEQQQSKISFMALLFIAV